MPVTVRPVQANLSHDTDFLPFDRMDPYVYLTLGGEKKKTSVCHSGGRTPTWGETFQFNNMSNDVNLAVEVWDKDTFSRDDLVGSGSLNLMPYMNGMPTQRNIVA